jgi:hypothetical protein
MSMHPTVRALAVGVAVLAASCGLSACGSDKATGLDIAAVKVAPTGVVNVKFTAAGQTAEIRKIDGIWVPGQGATAQGAVLLEGVEDRVFPVNAYRIIEPGPGVDQTNAVYGLTEGSGRSMEVVDSGGRTWKLTIGRPTFNLAGFYAKVDGDPRIFLITSQQVGDIISFATGRQFSFPLTSKYRQVDQKLNEAATEGQNDTPDYHPWLKQALAKDAADLDRVSASIISPIGSGSGPADKGQATGPYGPSVPQSVPPGGGL